MIRLTKSTFYREPETKEILLRFISEAKQLSFGPECLKFEKAFAAWQGSKDAMFVNSGSSANLALFQALINLGRLKAGDKVGFSAVTWSTNVMPLIQLGLVPVPLDISLETLNVTSTEVERAINEHGLKAVFITNLLGFSHDLTRIKEICKKNNVLLYEDNCEGLGSVEQGVKFGNFGQASTFSFFVGHHLSTIEGGMIATNDEELAEAIRITRAHGWDRHLSPEQQQRLREKYNKDNFYNLYTFYDLGYNFRPTEINAVIGIATLPYADEITEKRIKIYASLAAVMKERPDAYRPLRNDHLDKHSAFAFPVLCTTGEIKNKLIAACKDIIEIRPIVGGDMALQPFFKKYFPNADKLYPAPNAAHVHNFGLYLPIHAEMDDADIETISKVLRSI